MSAWIARKFGFESHGAQAGLHVTMPSMKYLKLTSKGIIFKPRYEGELDLVLTISHDIVTGGSFNYGASVSKLISVGFSTASSAQELSGASFEIGAVYSGANIAVTGSESGSAGLSLSLGVGIEAYGTANVTTAFSLRNWSRYDW